jgi:UDP-N-acetyl-D-glucosamine dehydrogenase
MAGFEPRFIELAGQVNSTMPEYVVSKVNDALNDFRKSVNGSKILVLGAAYKRDVNDTRESPAIDVIRLLEEKGGRVDYSDPHVDEIQVDGTRMRSVRLTGPEIRSYDCIVIVTDHSAFDYKKIVKNALAIVDTRNALKDFDSTKIRRI